MKKLFMHYIFPSFVAGFKEDQEAQNLLAQNRIDAFGSEKRCNQQLANQQNDLIQFKTQIKQWQTKMDGHQKNIIKMQQDQNKLVDDMQHMQYMNHLSDTQVRKELNRVHTKIIIFLGQKLKTEGKQKFADLLTHIVDRSSLKSRD